MRPMLATKGSHVPGGGEWLHEVKWDGMRVLVEVRPDGELHIRSRNEKDVKVSFPELHGLAALRRDLLLDGEVVAFLDGIPTFGALADRMHVGNARRAAALAETNPVTLLVFDLLRLDGEDLTGRPLSERRELLEGLGLLDVHWQVPATYDDGAMLLEATEQQKLEGDRVEEAVLALPPRPPLAGLAEVPAPRHRLVRRRRLAARDRQRLAHRSGARGGAHAGRTASTAAGSAAASPARPGNGCSRCWARCRPTRPPFVDEVPAVDAKGTTWVRPEVVVDIAALGHDPGEAAAPAVVPRRPQRPVARGPGGRRWLRRRARR